MPSDQYSALPEASFTLVFQVERIWLTTLSGVLWVLSNRDAPGLIRAAAHDSRGMAMLESILYGGFAYHFYRAVEDAKIVLSRAERTTIDFHRPEIDISIPVTRSAFEALIAPDLEVIRERIVAALDPISFLTSR